MRAPGAFDAEAATDEDCIAELMTYWPHRDTVIHAVNDAADRSQIGTRQAVFDFARTTLLRRRRDRNSNLEPWRNGNGSRTRRGYE